MFRFGESADNSAGPAAVERAGIKNGEGAAMRFVRGLAALAVASWHLRLLVFDDYGSLDAPGAMLKAFYFVTGFGHQAVMVFFVLSGYWIGREIFTKFDANPLSWTDYAIRLCYKTHRAPLDRIAPRAGAHGTMGSHRNQCI